MTSTWGFGVARTDVGGPARAALADICESASRATSERFAPYVAASYTELSKALEEGTISVAWMPPIPALELDEKKSAVVLALPARKGMASYHAAFITRRGGPRSLHDCQGGRAVWVDAESASGYLVPRIHLASLGIDVARFFRKETFSRTHLAVVEAVLAGNAEVGATYCSFEPGTKRILSAGWTQSDGTDSRPIEVLSTAGPIPNDAIVASTKLPLPLRGALTRWLLHLAPDERALFQQLLRASEFRVVPPAHFDSLKHMIRAARSRGL